VDMDGQIVVSVRSEAVVPLARLDVGESPADHSSAHSPRPVEAKAGSTAPCEWPCSRGPR